MMITTEGWTETETTARDSAVQTARSLRLRLVVLLNDRRYRTAQLLGALYDLDAALRTNPYSKARRDYVKALSLDVSRPWMPAALAGLIADALAFLV